MSKMTCEDCIHSEVCCSYLIADEDFEITSPEKMANSCDDFADRSRFVELPCKLGDTVYYFNHVETIYSQKVMGFIVNSVGILVDSDVMFDSHMMGDRFFSTREEAEQALKLKERET